VQRVSDKNNTVIFKSRETKTPKWFCFKKFNLAQKKEKSFNPPFENFPIDKINKTYISKNACIYQKVTHLKSNYVFNIYYKKYCAPRISGTQQQKWNGKKTIQTKIY